MQQPAPQVLVDEFADPDEPGPRRSTGGCLIEQHPACHVHEEIGAFSQIDRAAAEHDPGVIGQLQLAPNLKPQCFAVETDRVADPGRCSLW